MDSIEYVWSKRLSTVHDAVGEDHPPRWSAIFAMILVTATIIGVVLMLAWAGVQIPVVYEFSVPAVAE